MRRRGESRCAKVKSIPTEEEISKEVTVFFSSSFSFSLVTRLCKLGIVRIFMYKNLQTFILMGSRFPSDGDEPNRLSKSLFIRPKGQTVLSSLVLVSLHPLPLLGVFCCPSLIFQATAG